MYQKYFKRLFDFSLALFALFIFSPIIGITLVALFFSSKGNPFFYQLRPGLNGKIFGIIKFKTMNDKKDSFGNLLSDEKRLTKVGNIVRKTSLDEIPQLINVIFGQMSLIGPRPLLPEYLDLYTKEQNKRHLVLPGITGWAQINGRNAISWEKKFELDIWYINNISFKTDCKILMLTFKKVFKKEGVSSAGLATTTAFNGKN